MRNYRYHWLACVAMAILIIGGLNWGLVGLFDFNLVKAIFGSVPLLERLIYILVGISAAYWIYGSLRCCGHHCDTTPSTTSTTPPSDTTSGPSRSY